jgi:hypothetical protein
MALARRLRLMLTGFFATVAVVMLFNFVVNPLGAWRHRVVSDLYRRVKFERVITPYLLRTSTPDTLLLGSSRVLFGMKIEQGVKDGFQNAAFSGSHLPEISKELDIALRNPHLMRIIWGVEFYTFDEFSNGCSPDTCARLDGNLRIKLTDSILSSDALIASWRLLARAATGNVTEAASMPIPWPAPFICNLFAHPEPPTLAGMDAAQRFREVSNLPEYRHFKYSPALVKYFDGLVDRIRRAHVELIAFVPPVSEYELEMIRQTGRWADFQRWKRDLAARIAYADFSGYNGVARSDRMFIDAWHMEPAVGAVIMRRLLGFPDSDCPDAAIVASVALPVTARNVDQMVALQEQRKDAAVATTPNVYSTTVAAAIVKRYGGLSNPSLSASR